jgi:hypothetical protein
MGALFSTQDNYVIHRTQGLAKGAGSFIKKIGKKIVKRGVRDSFRNGYISKGIDSAGDLLIKGYRKGRNMVHNGTEKVRKTFRKNKKNYQKLQMDNNPNKKNNLELLPATANENVSAQTNPAANNAAAKKAAANKAAANNDAAKKAAANPELLPATAKENVSAQTNPAKNNGSIIKNTSSTKAANNEMYSSILKKLEGLKKDMKKKVDEEFRSRISNSKLGSKTVTISQIGGPNFTRLIKLFLIIKKLRNNNNNTKKLELDLKNLLELKVIDKKTKNPKKSEELLEEYKTEINTIPIDVLKKEFNEECKELFPLYTEIDESEIPQINSPNNNARSVANTVVGNSNQSNLTEELSLLDNSQTAVASGGSHKKSKKSRS